MKTIRVGTTILATVVAIAALSSVAQAVPVAYTIDPLQSFVTTGGTLFGVPLLSQIDASNTGALGGTLVGDLSGVTLTLTGGSTIDAALHPFAAAFLPVATSVIPNTGTGVEGNLAVSAATVGLIGVNTVAAIRDLMFDMPAGSITNGAPPALATLSTTSGRISSNIAGPSSATNAGLPNITALNASLSDNGLIETVIIPFQTNLVSGSLVSTAVGQIVATRVIPEPSAFVLAGLGIVGMALAAWRKRHAV